MDRIKNANIEAKRREVNHAYAVYGVQSKEYQQSFDNLHNMNMTFMADRYRKEWGLPPNAKTPYC